MKRKNILFIAKNKSNFLCVIAFVVFLSGIALSAKITSGPVFYSFSFIGQIIAFLFLTILFFVGIFPSIHYHYYNRIFNKKKLTVIYKQGLFLNFGNKEEPKKIVSISFDGTAGTKGKIKVTYTFNGDSYVFDTSCIKYITDDNCTKFEDFKVMVLRRKFHTKHK